MRRGLPQKGADADADLDRFVQRRAAGVPEDRVGQERANELERMWEASARRFEEKKLRRLRAEWHRHHDHLACVFGRMAEEHAKKANALSEGNEPKGAA